MADETPEKRDVVSWLACYLPIAASAVVLFVTFRPSVAIAIGAALVVFRFWFVFFVWGPLLEVEESEDNETVPPATHL